MIQLQNKQTLAILSLIAAGAVSVFISIQISTNAQSEPKETQVQNNQVRPDARRRFVELDDAEWRQNVPLRALVSQSRAVVIGTPGRNVSRPSHDGNQVTTDYQITIQEVIKGSNLAPGSEVSVSMPGGLVTEADGTFFEARARGIRKMQYGKKYVMFLKESGPGGNSAFMPIHGSQGLFEIPQNGTRVIHLGRSFELAPADDGEEIQSFLENIRTLSRR